MKNEERAPETFIIPRGEMEAKVEQAEHERQEKLAERELISAYRYPSSQEDLFRGLVGIVDNEEDFMRLRLTDLAGIYIGTDDIQKLVERMKKLGFKDEGGRGTSAGIPGNIGHYNIEDIEGMDYQKLFRVALFPVDYIAESENDIRTAA